MIRKLAAILLLSVVPLHNAIAAPQWAQKPIQCGTVEEVLNLVNSYGEQPYIFFEGKTSRPDVGATLDTKFVITMNSEEKNWTLIEIPDDEQACILGAGKGELNIADVGITT